MDWSSLHHDAPEWYKDAKFGLFFHWGPVSVPAYENEWYSRNIYCKGSKQNIYHEQHYGKLKDFGYKDFFPMFKGENFDPDEWADLVVRSGAKYAGPVSEHADNFSMWHSKVNPVNSVTYMGRDVVGECAAAFRKQNIKVLATFHHSWLWGWFMSTDNEADVYDPKNEVYYGPALPLETNRMFPYRLPDDKFCKVWLEKIKEVSQNYKPDVLYYDSRTCIIPEEYRYAAADFYYNACGIKDGIMTYKGQDFPEKLGVYDVERGRFKDAQSYTWQTDDRLEDNITWCIVQNPKYIPAPRILQQLCDVVSKNGNLLLNVGPREDGTFAEEAKKELYAIGDWLKKYGEAIYGTRPFYVAAEGVTEGKNEDYNAERVQQQIKQKGIEMESGEYKLTGRDFRFTKKGNSVYAIAMGAPKDGAYTIHALRRDGYIGDNITVSIPGFDGKVEYTRDTEGMTVKIPEGLNESLYVIKVTENK